MQQFLQSKNPSKEHSFTLESYLIKPIQRILKYPLLLQQLKNLTREDSEERQHLMGKMNINIIFYIRVNQSKLKAFKCFIIFFINLK